MLTALNSITAEKNNSMASTKQAVRMLLDYTATNPNTKIRLRRSDMNLCIHSNASYLSKKKDRSRAPGYFYLGKEKPLQQKQNVEASVRMAEKPAHYEWP
eukprot:14393451-Ditylum_brightwellii.AAC.1